MLLFSNFTPRLKTLIVRWKRGAYRDSQRTEAPPVRDSRGEVVRRVETPQTFLTAAEVDTLIEDYRVGATITELAKKYDVHRATVSSHLTRRGVTRRPTGLTIEEAAEAVRLHQEGSSIRAIARSTGADRKTVRAYLDREHPSCGTERISSKKTVPLH